MDWLNATFSQHEKENSALREQLGGEKASELRAIEVLCQ